MLPSLCKSQFLFTHRWNNHISFFQFVKNYCLKMPGVNFTYRGMIAPVFTPFNNDEKRSLNLSVIPEYAKFLTSKNVNGVLVNGSSGEGTLLTVEERKKVSESWAAAVKETKQHLMIQVGGAALSDVKELAAHAEKIGADSLLCLPELYFKPTNVKELTEYLKNVGESAPKTPLLYYHYPKSSMVNIHMGDFFEYVGEKIPTFVGIKFTSNDLEEGLKAMKTNNSLAVFLGCDVLTAAGATIGMDSFIMTTLNFIPEPALEILDFGKDKKDLTSARKNQDYINKVTYAITRHGTWVETMKVAMNLLTNIYVGPPRAPLKLLAREDRETMARNLTEIGLTVNKTAALNMY